MLPSERINQLRQMGVLNPIETYLDQQYIKIHHTAKPRKIEPPIDTILRIIKKHHPIRHTKLLQYAHRIGNAQVLHRLLEELELTNKIESFMDGHIRLYLYKEGVLTPPCHTQLQ